MAIPKTVIGVEVQGADKAAGELAKVSRANQQVEKTAADAKSIDGLSKKFDELSGSVGKGMSKLNDIGDMFKIVGVFAGGAAFGGLADIGEAFRSISDALGITTVATKSWQAATGIANEGLAKTAAGVDNLKEHIDSYVKSVGLASEAELTWSQRQQALRDIQEGRIVTLEQRQKRAEKNTNLAFLGNFMADIREGVGLDGGQYRKLAKILEISANADEDAVTNAAVQARNARKSEEQNQFYEGLYDRLKEGGGPRKPSKTTRWDGPTMFDEMWSAATNKAEDFFNVLQRGWDKLEIDALIQLVDDAKSVPDDGFGGSSGSFEDVKSLSEWLDGVPPKPSVQGIKTRDAFEKELFSYLRDGLLDDTEGTQKEMTGLLTSRIASLQSVGAASPSDAYAFSVQAAEVVASGDLEKFIALHRELIAIQEQLRLSTAFSWENIGYNLSSAFGGAASQMMDFGSMAVSVMGTLTGAVGSMMTNFIIAGESGADSIKKTVGNALAGISAQAFGYSIFLAALGAAAALSGPIFGFEAPGLFAAAGVMAGAGVALGVTARALGADKVGQSPKGAGGGGSGGGGSTSLSNPYKPEAGDTKVTVIIGGEVVTRGVKTETRRQNLRGGISEGRMAMAT